MTTIHELATALDEDLENVEVLVGQLYDAPDLWDPETETLSPAGVEVVTDALRDSTRSEAADAEIAVTEAVRALDDHAEQLGALVEARNATIVEARRVGVPYARLQEMTGLSRSQLDTIRRGQTRRS